MPKHFLSISGMHCASCVEEIDSTKQFRILIIKTIIAAMIGIPLFLDLFFKWLPAENLPYIQWSWIVIALIVLLGMAYSGGHIFRSAALSFINRSANMNTLVALGTAMAWLYSTIIILIPQFIPIFARHVYFDTGILIIAFIDLGAALELRARGKTSQAIKHLIGLQPKTARIIKNHQEIAVPLEKIQIGDLIRVRPGEKIPVDGIIVEGQSQINESMLTGEAIATVKKQNDEVIAGTINETGSFIFRATRIGKDTVLAKIIDLVRRAQNAKPKISRLVDYIAAIFTPLVIIVAIITALIWFNWGPMPRIIYALITTISVLVIACPCALGLATPISIIAGIGKAAESGILIRNGDALQESAGLTSVVLDKTGTITAGRPQVMNIQTYSHYSENELLTLAASVEINSEHPLAQAITAAAQKLALPLKKVEEFQNKAGYGVIAKLNGAVIKIGNQKLLGIDDFKTIPTEGTPIYIGENDKVLGVLIIADPIKKESREAIKKFHDMHLKVVMITGDAQHNAEIIAKQVAIDEVYASVLPQDKEKKIKELQRRGEIVAMVGDGINDAPALAAANVGFAIGTGTDIAIESGSITLISGSLLGVVNAIKISQATMRNIKQNLFGAFIYNTISIPIAAGIFYPLFHTLLNPLIAAAAMAASSLTVVLNANRLRLFKG